MIRLGKLCVAMAILWSLYWVAAGYGLRGGLQGWFTTQENKGWQAEYAEMSGHGYPLRHVTRIEHPVLADPVTGVAWRADWLSLDSPAIWPGRQTMRFAQTPQLLSYFDQTVTILAQDMMAQLSLAPGLALELEDLALTSDDWSIRQEQSTVTAAQTLHLQMQQLDPPQDYAIDLTAQGFQPGTKIRTLMGSDNRLPDRFDALTLQATITFDRPWDRTALETARPQPRAISLKQIDAHWGVLRIRATGELQVDDQGVPTGAIMLKAENWRDMLRMAETAGALPARAVEPAERVLGMMAGLGGNPNTLDVQLNFRDGYVALGPLPLGPAPRLILR
ncbi:DUF2125 domain-containing protein [Aliisedimentitalea scapharcae]|uniref:DUF2125 domain-containing protein n=1 Tax=Aliisedimentitalea scapharcae TaxID=1524259 RepID=A0ABZ2XWL8_9RHOB